MPEGGLARGAKLDVVRGVVEGRVEHHADLLGVGRLHELLEIQHGLDTAGRGVVGLRRAARRNAFAVNGMTPKKFLTAYGLPIA